MKRVRKKAENVTELSIRLEGKRHHFGKACSNRLEEKKKDQNRKN